MENNTLLSHELEQMRTQIGMLKQKLEQQAIVNDMHIHNSMKSKISDLNRTVRGTIIAGIFAVVFAPVTFYIQGASLAFVISTAVMLAVCLGLTIVQKINLGKMMDAIKGGMEPNEAYQKNLGTYGRFKAEDGAVKWIDPRKE